MTQEEVDKINAQLAVIAKQTRYLLDTHQYTKARDLLLSEALTLAPNHQIVLSDIAYCEQRLRNLPQAHAYLIQALEHHKNIDPEVYDTLTNVCNDMKRYEEARYYARLAIQRKKALLAENPPEVYPVPNTLAPGISNDKRKNVICYSLFGDKPRYCETAVLNVNLAKVIYPEWTCRFYLDDSVPTDVINRLEACGAEVIRVTPEQQKISGLFWRFFIFDDPNVQCFIIRDADSMLSYKEKAAVDEWLKSGKWFHILRDSLVHSELILAGMWGGYGGVLNNLETLSENFYRNLQVRNKTIDQHFLRTLYPTVEQSVLIHDNFMLDRNSQLFPDYPLSDIEKIPYFHIGMVDSGIETITIALHDHQPSEPVRWYLKNQNDEQICSYTTNAVEKDGKYFLQLNLPYFYSRNVSEGKWHFCYSI